MKNQSSLLNYFPSLKDISLKRDLNQATYVSETEKNCQKKDHSSSKSSLKSSLSPSRKRKVIKQQYDVISKIGQGSFASVYSVRGLKDNLQYAVKVFDMDKIEKFHAQCTIISELEILQKLTHKNIVNLYHVNSKNNKYQFLMQLSKGKTLNKLMKESQLSIQQIKMVFKEII